MVSRSSSSAPSAQAASSEVAVPTAPVAPSREPAALPAAASMPRSAARPVGETVLARGRAAREGSLTSSRIVQQQQQPWDSESELHHVPSSSPPEEAVVVADARSVHLQPSSAPASGAPEASRVVATARPSREAEVRYYAVWRLPGHASAVGLHYGPHPAPWLHLCTLFRGGQLPGSGATLRRCYSLEEAHRVYEERAARFGLASEAVVRHIE